MKTFLEPLSREEESEYLKRFKDGDQEAKDVLITRNLRLVAHVVKKYASQERDMEDLISIGIIGLIKAVMSFDESKGKLSTYAAKCIDNELLMMLRSEKKYSKDVSLYEPIGTDYDGNEVCHYDVIVSKEPEIDVQCEKADDIVRVLHMVQEELSEQERRIICKRYGLFGEEEQTQREVAKELGISRSYVSRIEKKALERLKKYWV